MKFQMRILKSSLLVLLTFSLFLFSTSSSWANCEKKIRMGWEDWNPYQYVNKKGTLTGLDIELVQAIVENMGCQIDFKEMPWKRHLLAIEKGRMDLAAGASITPERQKYANFSNPYRTESTVLYVHKGESGKYKLKTLQDIVTQKFSLGVTRGYYYGEEYTKWVKNKEFKNQIQEVHNDSFNYYKLQKKRIDGFLADPIAATAGLKGEDLLGMVEIHPMKVYSDNIYVMMSKKSVSKQFIKDFNKSLAQIKANGTHDRILKKYLQ